MRCGDVVFVKRAGGGRAVLVRRLCQVASSDGGVVQAVGVYSPPMLLKDTELCGEYDGVDAPNDMGVLSW